MKKRYFRGMILKYDFATNSALGQGAIQQRKENLANGLDTLESEFSALQLDAIILTSIDPFISEYIPLENNHRYGVTAFSGSTGDAIYWTKNSTAMVVKSRVSLFADGPYHLQADNECPLNLVEVVKVEFEPSIN